MTDTYQHKNLKYIVDTYFSSPERCISLEKGEVLLDQGAENHRLYYIHSGKVCGFLPDQHLAEPVFEATSGSFVGVYSFCAEEHKSYSRVSAVEPTRIYYYERSTGGEDPEFSHFLAGLVVLELRARQRYAAEMAHDRQQVMNKLIKTEKLATLGQLSAGLAHELNNAVGSLSANLRQLEQEIKQVLESTKPAVFQEYFFKALGEGWPHSTLEARARRSEWSESGLNPSLIRKLAKTDIQPAEITSPRAAQDAIEAWGLGALLHDMHVASQQATHVIGSVKSMGIARQKWTHDVDVPETVREAVSILRSMTRYVDLTLELDSDVPPIEACHGEIVQVWINLIKNAIESLRQSKTPDPMVRITCRARGNRVITSIEDNGPGIDPAFIDRIYEPHFTTKVEGISLGLGLGLTIVQRIISEHDGTLDVSSSPGSTLFKVTLQTQPKP